MPHGWPCWAISNHDVQRAVTRWGDGADDAARQAARRAGVLAARLGVPVPGRGTGLTEAEVPFEALQDPYGIAFWPNFKGRDGCRTPMPWTDAPTAGFSDGKPWLPVAEAHRARSVDVQDADAGSVLNGARAFLRWRKPHPALVQGDIAFLDAPEPVLAFVRGHDGESLLVAFNLSEAEVEWTLPEHGAATPVRSPGHGERRDSRRSPGAAAARRAVRHVLKTLAALCVACFAGPAFAALPTRADCDDPAAFDRAVEVAGA